MENNKKTKYVGTAISLLLLIILLITLGFSYKLIFLNKVSVKSNTPPITIKEDKYNKVTNPTNYGVPISTSEEGFGRENPFLPYK